MQLCFGEELSVRTGGAAGGLLKYVSLAGLGVHLCCASELKPRVVWPRADPAVRQLREARGNVLAAFLSARGSSLASRGGMAALAGCGIDKLAGVLDCVSPLLSIVAPPLRAVQLSLLNSRERRDAEALVSTLISCGLTSAPRLPGAPAAAQLADLTAAGGGGADGAGRRDKWRGYTAGEDAGYGLSP